MGHKLSQIYAHAYSVTLTEKTQQANMEDLARAMSDDILEAGSRRAFVKAAVALLIDQHRTGERPLTPAEIQKLARTAQVEESRMMDGEREI